MFCMLKNKHTAFISKQLKSWKISCTFNDSKWKMMALSCSKKAIGVIFIPLERKASLNCIIKYVKNNFCNVIMPSEDTKILDFN